MAAQINFEDWLALTQLYADYAGAVDSGQWDSWPDFFTDDCVYRLQPRENHERGFPLARLPSGRAVRERPLQRGLGPRPRELDEIAGLEQEVLGRSRLDDEEMRAVGRGEVEEQHMIFRATDELRAQLGRRDRRSLELAGQRSRRPGREQVRQRRLHSCRPGVEGEKALVMSEEQRVAYVEKFVVVKDLELVQDTKPNSEEPVPGLFRVKGVVTNNGDQKLDKIMLNVFPENANGDVIGSYIQNIAGPTGLAPGGTRDFHFQVPEKKEYGGKFRHTLR